MRVLTTFILLSLSIMLAACGNQNASNSSVSQFDNFINANDGIEFKAPNKIQSNTFSNQQQVYGNYEQSEILLTLDHNGTFHMRASIPAGMNTSDTELEGVRGTWEIDSRGLLQLNSESGEILARSSYNLNQTESNSFALTINQVVNLDILQVNTNTNVNNYSNFTSYGVTTFPLQGMATVSR